MTTAVDGAFEIRAPGWFLTFQRRVLDVGDTIHSANRGILPRVVLATGKRDRLIAVPLADAESLWIAVTCDPDDSVRGWTIDGDPLGVSVVSRLGPRSVLLAVDAVKRQGRSYPIDRRVVMVARSAQSRLGVSLVVAVSARRRTEVLRIALMTPRSYTRLSGRPAPPPSRPEHAYRGWLLP